MATRPLSPQLQYTLAEAEQQRILATLQAELTPEQYQRVWQYLFQLDLAHSGVWMGEVDWFVEQLAQHLPAFAPTIRALAVHLLEDGRPQRARRDWCAEPWPAARGQGGAA